MTGKNTSQKIKNLKRNFYLRYSITSALVIIIVVFINLIANQIPWIYDMTSDKLFTLSDQTKSVIADLKAPVEIFAVYPKGGEDPFLMSLLTEYEKLGGLVSVEYIDAERDPGKIASLNSGANSITNGTVIVRANDRLKFINPSEIFQSSQAGNTFWGESQITGAIKYVTTDEKPVVYFLEGHDEASLTNTISHVASALELNVLDVKPLSLMKMGAVPEDASLVVVSSPKSDISDSEYEMLSTYMENGGKLLMMVDVINSNTTLFSKFNQLLHGYGIDITNNIIVEEDPYSHVSNNNLFLIPGYAYHAITKALAESKRYIILPIAMGLHTLDVDTNQVILEPLLASSQRSWMRTDMASKSTSKTEADQQGPIALAYASTRSESKNNNNSQVVVIGNSSFIFNENFDSNANRDFFMSSVNWLTGGVGENSISPRIIGADKFIIRGVDFTRLFIITLIVIPLIPLICAFVIWYYRRNQ